MRVDVRRALEPLASSRRLPAAGQTPRFDPHQLWASLQADPRWQDWQEGRMTPRQWHAHLTARLGIALTLEEFCDAWNRALDPVTILSDSFFEHLQTRYRLALLSNTDPLHSAYLDDHFTFGRYFAARIYSCAVGATKPSPVIYQAALAALGIAAQDALYIDDIPEYAIAARNLGLDAIRFQDPPQLMQELAERKILVP